jgi:hypothetical protein
MVPMSLSYLKTEVKSQGFQCGHSGGARLDSFTVLHDPSPLRQIRVSTAVRAQQLPFELFLRVVYV